MSKLNPLNTSASTETTTNNTVLASQVVLSNTAVRVFLMICYGVVIQIVNVFGIGTNIINIVCFLKQGLKDAVNVSLLGLAISDIGCLVTLIWSSLCLTPQFQEADLPFDPIDINYLTTGVPHVVFTRVTSSITALIMVERCLCITMPFKVKNVFRPKRVAITIACIYILLIASISSVYYVNRFQWKFDPQKNRTILGITFTENKILVEQISFTINNICVPFIALLVIVICMIIITMALQKQAKWRLKCIATSELDSKGGRDQKVAKMIVMISTLFVICFSPSGIIFIALVVVPGFQYNGVYHNELVLSYSFSLLLESTNSSSNIFIYYHMSSKYRTCFRELFGLSTVLNKKSMLNVSRTKT